MRPLSTQSLPSRRAVVVMLCEFEPASGSVMPKAMMIEPSAIPGSQRCFCSSVPKRPMIVPLIAGDTTIISSPHPAALSSSPTIDSSYMPAPPPPYSSGRLRPEEAALAGLGPELAQRLARPGARCGVVVAVTLAEFGDRLPQRLLLVGLAEVHVSSPSVAGSVTTASTAPTSICCPTLTGSSLTTPSVGALIWCCIFMASSHRIGWPAVTGSPTATAMRTTDPGIGASSDPAATCSAGSTKRGSARRCTGPSGEST